MAETIRINASSPVGGQETHVSNSRDIPVGTLHLIHLGLTKHLVQLIVNTSTTAQLEKMEIHLCELKGDCFGANFFKHHQSKQGKYFKSYLEVAPINLSFGKASRHIIKMSCTLAKLQKAISTTEMDSASITNIEELVQRYIQLTKQHEPQLLNKVKTHLLLHLKSDIERHGPPAAYCEDAFEKMHGSVRDRLFLSNQKSRSKDTAAAFARLSVANHIFTGGYYNDGHTWKQSSEEALNIASMKEVKMFLGAHEPEDAIDNKVINIKRDRNHKVIFTEASNAMKLRCHSFGLDILDTDARVAEATGAKLVNGTIAHSKEGLEYKTINHGVVIGILQDAMIVKAERRQMCVVSVQQLVPTGREVAGCTVYSYGGNIDTVPVDKIQRAMPVMHDCSDCRIVERNNKRVIKHHTNNYLYNIYV